MVAVDPKAPITVGSSRQFVIALRAVEDGGYTWRLTAPPRGDVVRADGEHSVWDAAFQNVGHSAAQFPLTGGAATELWLFSARRAGTVKLTFGLYGPGATTPTRTTSYSVTVTPLVAVC